MTYLYKIEPEVAGGMGEDTVFSEGKKENGFREVLFENNSEV